MARVRRSFSPFNISFLDIMSCGFGAAVLLFLIIKHNVETNPGKTPEQSNVASEVKLLDKDILTGKKGLAQVRNSLAEVENKLVVAKGLANRVTQDINKKSGEVEALSTNGTAGDIEKLKEKLKQMDQNKQRLEKQNKQTGQDVRKFVGNGDREYLTGLKLGGNRILILLDCSASMLGKTIVNIILRRNMSDDVKRHAKKWQRALKTVDWLSAKFPPTSHYQIYTFNTAVKPVISGTRGQWLQVSNRDQLNQAIRNMKKIIPAGGTNLEKAFTAVSHLNPLPDNIYLITDGLPTQGQNPPRSTTITSQARQQLFENAVRQLPARIPINIILEPMQGDPMAAFEFWQLAHITRGSLISPTDDWP